MRGSRFSFLGLILLLSVASPAMLGAQERPSVTYNGVEYFLPAPREQIVLPPNIPATHTVVSGDTLWGIARQYLQDPFLWPLVWEANLEEVPNPHLIFPGQVLALLEGAVFPSGSTEGQRSLNFLSLRAFREEEPETVQYDRSGLAFEDLFDPNAPRPAASDSVINTAGFIAPTVTFDAHIIEAERPYPHIGLGEIVYIDQGSNHNVQAGQEFEILRDVKAAHHPHTDQYLGQIIQTVGRLKVVCVQENSSIAIISKAYTYILRSDYIAPYTKREAPMTTGSPQTDVCEPARGDVNGVIVQAGRGSVGVSDAIQLGPGDVAYLDVGRNANVTPGQYFVVFRENRLGSDFPRIQIGELIVLTTEDNTSTAMVTGIRREIAVGDRIQLK